MNIFKTVNTVMVFTQAKLSLDFGYKDFVEMSINEIPEDWALLFCC